MAQAALEILVQARDQATSTFAKVGASAERMHKQVAGGIGGGAGAGAGGGIGGIAMAGLGRIGVGLLKIEAALRIAGAAYEALRATSLAARGEAEKAREGWVRMFEAIEAIPIIGTAYGLVERMGGFKARLQNEIAAQKAREEAWKDHLETMKRYAEELSSLNRELGGIGLQGGAKELYDLYSDMRGKLKTLNEDIIKLNARGLPATDKIWSEEGQKLMDRGGFLQEIYQRKVQEIHRREAEAREKLAVDAWGNIRRRSEDQGSTAARDEAEQRAREQELLGNTAEASRIRLEHELRERRREAERERQEGLELLDKLEKSGVSRTAVNQYASEVQNTYQRRLRSSEDYGAGRRFIINEEERQRQAEAADKDAEKLQDARAAAWRKAWQRMTEAEAGDGAQSRGLSLAESRFLTGLREAQRESPATRLAERQIERLGDVEKAVRDLPNLIGAMFRSAVLVGGLG